MASVLISPCQPQLLKNHRLHGNCHTKSASNSNLVIKCQKTCSFNYRKTINVPLQELPEASFDHYMDDKHRVFRAVFPDKGSTKQLNEGEWRIKMPPIQCLFINVYPTADVRLTFKSNGQDYPPNIPHHVTKILELHFLRWELQGIVSRDFTLDVRGTLYPERKGNHSWLSNEMEMKMSFCSSPAIALIPDSVLQEAMQLVFKRMMDEMRQEFHGKLLADYGRFKRDKSKKNSV
ncbi:uncharacterized protein LOC130957943 [Arachis stenosperma]|uniref:uncharacterized protein LOC130957943 n=1 Tax=Arachis stenosperma TaxID=217475 RepID=UPI0025AC112B|nr:uncharacterized protein LOC130957943 [Arachis stenosperma]